jgi:hypothetical protein
MYRRCMMCRRYKPITRFSKDKSRKSGRAFRCKRCNYKHVMTMSKKPGQSGKRRAYMREYTRGLKLQFITAYGGTCN